jgi:hypothetical protein
MNKLPLFAKLGAIGLLMSILQGTASAAPVVTQPLPPALEGPGPAQPSPNHIWIPGQWFQTNDGYSWAAGHWDLAPRPGASWIPAHWEGRNGGFVLIDGIWKDPPPPVVVQQAPLPPEQEVAIEAAPPPPQTEVIIERPSPRHVWIAGYWGWREGRHTWMAGHWELPPRDHVVWEAPRWESREGRYVFVPGRWHEGEAHVEVAIPLGHGELVLSAGNPLRHPAETIIREGPPPPRREVMREHDRPSSRHVWIAGYWGWHEGKHVWMGGHWELPPREHAVWEAPRWESRNGGFVFVEGRWR